MSAPDTVTNNGKNLAALLDTIAFAEIGDQIMHTPGADDGYAVLVGSYPGHVNVFTDYSAHPLMGRPIEYSSGCWSTAAGRYQILDTYWPHYRDMLGLPDFGPTSQDRYAIQQIKEQDAYAPILAGQFETALSRISNIWASIPGPGNTYGQRIREYDRLAEAYTREGGVIA